jgi:hypothetical protein
MKKILIFIFISYFCFSQEELKHQILPIDSSKTEVVIDANKYEFSKNRIFGGIGMTTGSTTNILFESDFYNGPALQLGYEYSLTQSDDYGLGLELSSHSWLCKAKTNMLDLVSGEGYNRIKDNYFGQFGLSGLLKIYFNAKYPFRFSINLGALFYSPLKDSRGPEFGFELYYHLNEYSSISLKKTYLFQLNFAEWYDSYYPNLLLLNYNFLF